MKVSNKFFINILLERLKNTKEKIEKADEILYHGGIAPSYKEYNAHRDKFEGLRKELATEYPNLVENIAESWDNVRAASLLLSDLIEGLEK